MMLTIDNQHELASIFDDHTRNNNKLNGEEASTDNHHQFASIFDHPRVSTYDDEASSVYSSSSSLPRLSSFYSSSSSSLSRSITESRDTMKYAETQEEADIVDKALAEEMENLCVAEKEKNLFDVHGLPTLCDEELGEEETKSKLAELDRELQEQLILLRRDSPSAIERVLEVRPEYLDDAFRLMFLRFERFDAEAAATKMIEHFDVKDDLFGPEALGRDIRLADLSVEDIRVLESGMLHFVPIRDASGRFVYFYNPKIYYAELEGKDGITTEHVVRAWWYTWMTMLRTNEELQKKGLVVIVNGTGMSNGFPPIAKELKRARDVMPMPKKAIHFCYDNKASRPWMASTKMYMQKGYSGTRFRTRDHHASDHTELLFKLQTYGIPITQKHFPSNGTAYVAWHLRWLTMRRAQEEGEEKQQQRRTSTFSTASTTIVKNSAKNSKHCRDIKENDDDDDDDIVDLVFAPTQSDVLFGKGRKMKEHPGNIACNLLCEEMQEAYERAGKFEKTDIAESIITAIHERGGRFLKATTGSSEDADCCRWREVDRLVAREKISHSFRRLRKRAGPATKKKNDSWMPSSPKRAVPLSTVEDQQYTGNNSPKVLKQIHRVSMF